MTKQEFLSELERALGKLPHAEVEQAIAFYDEAISDRMEDGLSEAEAVADLGPVDEIAAQIAAETPPIPRAIARANTGSRTLNIVLLAAFSPIWIPIVLALAAATLAVYVAIWAVIAALWAVDAVLVLMPFAGLCRPYLDPGRGHAAARRVRIRPLARVERLRTRRLLRRVLGQQTALPGNAFLRALDREPVRARVR
ncbi:MAG: DUF1700 domain-containing protein [Collinsella sp.]